MDTASEASAGEDAPRNDAEYETQRIKNIERNRQQLENLGLLYSQGGKPIQRPANASSNAKQKDSRTRRSTRGESVMTKLKRRKLPGESSGESEVSEDDSDEYVDEEGSEFLGSEGQGSGAGDDEDEWMAAAVEDEDEPITDEDEVASLGGTLRPQMNPQRAMQMQIERQKQWAELSAKADPTRLAQFTLELARVLLRCYLPTAPVSASVPPGPNIFTPKPIPPPPTLHHPRLCLDDDPDDPTTDSNAKSSSHHQQQAPNSGMLGVGARAQAMTQSLAALGVRPPSVFSAASSASSGVVGMGGGGMVAVKGVPDPSVPLYVEFGMDHFADDIVKAMANHILTDLGLDPRSVTHACRKLYGIFPPRDTLPPHTVSAINGFVTTALRVRHTKQTNSTSKTKTLRKGNHAT
eukprot:c19628_g1_i1.p1 GENE.c19628_g1_i1~~c19628_g1_i1.p1  ORF type:complete len:466 (-),score=119.99 c19628_g1_i1:1487-2710(-)